MSSYMLSFSLFFLCMSIDSLERYIVCFVLFFFSSRRRHTRYWRDWSSDVCSSDLERKCANRKYEKERECIKDTLAFGRRVRGPPARVFFSPPSRIMDSLDEGLSKIGRASCRERV